MFRSFRVRAVAALGLATLFASSAPADPGPPKKVASVEGITEYRLDNGARILLYPDSSSPRVTVNMTVLVGSRHEGYGETGMAHLLEHMVFKGTPKHGDIPKLMKEKGASFNGSTSFDRTNYYETMPASDENLEFGLSLEADRLVNSYVKDEDLRTEFTVVRNEFERGENSPSSVLGQRMMAAAYEWHNYGKDTIGNRTDIERVPITNLQAFYKRFYQPDNVVVVVAGKFDEKKALEIANKTFGAIPKPDRKLDKTYTEEPPQDGERVVILRRVGDVPVIGLLYHVPSGVDPEFPAVQVLAGVMSAQPSGKLYKSLVETKKVASVSAFARPTHDPGVIEITAELKKDSSVDEIRESLISLVENIDKDGITEEAVERAKRQNIKARELSSTDVNQVGVRLSESIALGDWRLYFLGRDRIEAVTTDQVKAVAAKYLTQSNRTVGVFLPADSPQRTPVPARPDIAKMMDEYKGRAASAAGEMLDASPMAIESRIQRPRAIEGIKVALFPRKTKGEMVYANLTLRYGDAANLKGMNDAAGFLSDLMTRGTKKMNRQQIQDALDENTARLGGGFGGGRGGRGGGGGGGGLGSVSFSVQTKKANLPAVLDILRQIVREPSLPADEFEVMKQQRLARIEEGKTEPTTLAGLRLQRLMSKYPKDDVRYVPTIDESIERLKGTTIDQVRTLYRDYLGASHGELAIVGDFEPSEVLPIMEKMLGGWTSGKPYARIERPAATDLEGSRETIVTPDKANALCVAGLALSMKDDDPDYPAMVAANFILGGGTLSSRIGNRLRQKEGLSYGASSSFSADPLDLRGGLMINAICNPNNLAKAIKCLDEEIAIILKDGVTEQELAEAKKGYLQQQQVRRASEQALPGLLISELYLGRTMQREVDLEKAIEALTPETVNKAMRKHVDPKKLIVIGAGDVKTDESK